jgi:hypothetical protein
MIPSLFLDRAEQGNSYIYINAEDIKKGLCYLQFEDLSVSDEGEVRGKIRISGLLDKGNLVPMSKQTPSKGINWLRGFKSETLIFGEELIRNGSLKPSELEVLKEHALFWEQNKAEMYGEYVKKRLWLSAANDSAMFIFNLEGRNNPSNEGEIVPGLIGCAWRGMELIGAGFTRTGNFGSFDFVTPSVTTGAPEAKTTIVRR